MLKILRIEGESMSPDYNNGDYVIVSRFPLLFNMVKINSVLVFKSSKFGVLIKNVSAIDQAGNRFYFKGTNQMSVSTELIGAIERKDIIGSVLFHFKKDTV